MSAVASRVGGRSCWIRAPAIFWSVGILALGTGFVTPSLRILVSRRLSSEGQGTALGSLQALQSLGSFLGPAIAGISYDLLGPTSPFLIAAALLVIVIALVARSPLSTSHPLSS